MLFTTLLLVTAPEPTRAPCAPPAPAVRQAARLMRSLRVRPDPLSFPISFRTPSWATWSASLENDVLPGGRRMAVTGRLLAHSWARLGFSGWQHNQDRKHPKGVAGAAVCPEHTRLKKAPKTTSRSDVRL